MERTKDEHVEQFLNGNEDSSQIRDIARNADRNRVGYDRKSRDTAVGGSVFLRHWQSQRTAWGAFPALQSRQRNVETETADDFVLQETTVIKSATITGLLPTGTPLDNIRDVEVEVYHVFSADSDVSRTSGPPAFSTPAVPTRVNSPSDVEIDTATRARSAGTLAISATLLNTSFVVANTVINGINVRTGGEGPFAGEEVEITLTFTNPIILPAGHYFFRPEVLLTSGDFLYLSGPRPIPGTPFSPDLQAWIRNANLSPDWLRIGTDIIDGGTPPTFNMAFSLTGETVPDAGTPGRPNCHGQSISAVAHQFGGTAAAASALGFSTVRALQDGFALFCE
jgi:hypothetical protein